MTHVVSLPESAFSFAKDTSVPGVFHAHFTIGDSADPALVDKICTELGLGKDTPIELRKVDPATGTVTRRAIDQLITVHLPAEDLFATCVRFENIKERISSHVRVTRAKLEAKADDDHSLSFFRYGEFHTKVSYRKDRPHVVSQVMDYVRGNHPTWLAVSVNTGIEARSHRVSHLYFTKRFVSGSSKAARLEAGRLCTSISDTIPDVARVKSSGETVIFDSTPSHDSWWA